MEWTNSQRGNTMRSRPFQKAKETKRWKIRWIRKPDMSSSLVRYTVFFFLLCLSLILCRGATMSSERRLPVQHGSNGLDRLLLGAVATGAESAASAARRTEFGGRGQSQELLSYAMLWCRMAGVVQTFVFNSLPRGRAKGRRTHVQAGRRGAGNRGLVVVEVMVKLKI